MGDAGEGLIDADDRIQERMEELARARAEKRAPEVRDPDLLRTIESLRLARVDLQRQLESATQERRRVFVADAIAEIDRRLAEASARARQGGSQ